MQSSTQASEQCAANLEEPPFKMQPTMEVQNGRDNFAVKVADTVYFAVEL